MPAPWPSGASLARGAWPSLWKSSPPSRRASKPTRNCSRDGGSWSPPGRRSSPSIRCAISPTGLRQAGPRHRGGGGGGRGGGGAGLRPGAGARSPRRHRHPCGAGAGDAGGGGGASAGGCRRLRRGGGRLGVAGEADQKIKKGPQARRSQLTENPDILATISHHSTLRPRLVVGFAAETENVVPNAPRQAPCARAATGSSPMTSRPPRHHGRGRQYGASRLRRGRGGLASASKAEVARRLVARIAGALA